MIEEFVPQDWKELQDDVCRILNECGYLAESPKKIDLVRGQAEVDVFAKDTSTIPPITYIFECKNWNKRVPLSVVHGFRTLVNDAGAHIGLIISSQGFQSGAYAVAASTNIQLLTWLDFETLFFKRWFKTYFAPEVEKLTDPLLEYVEPFNSKIQRMAEGLDSKKFKVFLGLREKYSYFAFFVMNLYAPMYLPERHLQALPIDPMLNHDWPSNAYFPKDIFNISSYRKLLSVLQYEVHSATNEFDELFYDKI